MTKCKPVDTLVDYSLPKLKIEAEVARLRAFCDATSYRCTVGSLQYLRITRPDLAFAVNVVYQSMHSPTVENWIAVKRILHFIVGTCALGIYIWLSTNLSLFVYCDTDLGVSKPNRKSTTEFAIFQSKPYFLVFSEAVCCFTLVYKGQISSFSNVYK